MLLAVGRLVHTHTQHAGAFDGSLAFQDESLVENEELKIENEAGTVMLYGLSWCQQRFLQVNPPTNLETGDHVNRTYLQEVRGPPWISKIDQTSPKGIDGLYMKSMGTTNTPMGWSGES